MRFLPLNFIRHKGTYVPLGGKSALKKRPLRKLRSEEVRPAVYFKFDQVVELSDGSTIKRKSVYPKVEWRMLQDQRTSTVWNPSKPDQKAMLAGESGKLAKFRRKFAGFADVNQQETDFDLDGMMSEDAEVIKGGKLAKPKK